MREEEKAMLEALEELRGIFCRAIEQEQKEAEEYWNSLPEDKRLLVAVYLFKKLYEHYLEGGTYRYLIYDRLGFDAASGAYVSLQVAGALDIHNFISGAGKNGCEEKEEAVPKEFLD